MSSPDGSVSPYAEALHRPAPPHPPAPPRAPVSPLDLHAPLADLTRALIDIPSVSGSEAALADAVEQTLRTLPHLIVERDGDTICARTTGSKPRRVLLAGHLDTVPIADNVPSRMRVREGREEIVGRGAVDMKAGLAVLLTMLLVDASCELTVIAYDHEEVASELNSLTRIARTRREWLKADLAILGEPTGGALEAGCKGTMQLRVTARGVAAHSARDWVGSNAIHALAPVLSRVAQYDARRAVIDGLEFREALNVVSIDGGIAPNVIPDAAQLLINYRFAPDRSVAEAEAHVHQLLDGLDVQIQVVDAAAGALPQLEHPLVQQFAALAARGAQESRRSIAAKQGWTDVARFTALGMPAFNFAPGDPLLCHTDDEHIAVAELEPAQRLLAEFLRSV